MNTICKYLIIFNFFWMGGCAALAPEKREPAAIFDLGAQRVFSANPHALEVVFLIPAVNASAWLDNSTIQYRLAYQDATRTNAYAQNRWAMTPAQMLTERLRARFAAASRGVVALGDGAKADVALRVELEDFSQSFDAAQSSTAVVRVRASLIDLATRTLLAQQSVSAQRPAAPNAPGAAQALAAASDAVIEDLFSWAAQRLKK